MFHSPDPDYQRSQLNFIYLTQIIKVASKYFIYLTQIIKVVFVIGPFIIVAFVNAPVLFSTLLTSGPSNW